MDIMSKFTPRVQRVFQLAREEAQRLRSTAIGAEHILLAILRLEDGGARMAMMALGVDRKQIRDILMRSLLLQNTINGSGTFPSSSESQKMGPVEISIDAKKIIFLAAAEAHAMGHEYIGTEHFLLAMVHDEETLGGKVLRQSGLSYDACREEVLSICESQEEEEGDDASAFEEDSLESLMQENEMSGNLLQAFGRNLTEYARKGRLDPVIGREKETQRCIQILCRRNKNNPLLIGDAGVGKTAIVEGLAQAIAMGNVPEILQKKTIYALDLPLMIAGTKFRGQFEERLKSVMEEIQKNGEIILFIDEIHTIIGAGSGEGSMDASNILKPALSRGEIQCIGATTVEEYRRHIEKDFALERRFQSIAVDEPSEEDTLKILDGLCHHYEEHHVVTYDDSAIQSAVKLAKRYINNRQFPDKAIDILDEAGARAHLRLLQKPVSLVNLEKRLEKCQLDKLKAVDEQDYEQAAQLRDLGKKLGERVEKCTLRWKKLRKEAHPNVTAEDVADVVSEWTKIPPHMVKNCETDRMKRFTSEMEKVVIGQSEVIENLSRALARAHAHLNDPRRPIGSFLFLGPSGVGKSLLARQLAMFIFGREEDLIQVDMSEYMEKHTVARIIGAPPGYEGHDEGGQLTEKIRRKPYSVVLFDEIEKAHPDMLQVLLQVLEDGSLTDSHGRHISFRNTIILMTSNVGAEYFQKNFTVGFNTSKFSEDAFISIRHRVLDDVRHAFKPEFLNRLGDILLFRPLDGASLETICEIYVKQLNGRLLDQNISISLDREAMKWVIAKDSENKCDARSLRSNFEKYVEDPLAKEILGSAFSPGKYTLRGDGDGLRISFQEKGVGVDGELRTSPLKVHSQMGIPIE